MSEDPGSPLDLSCVIITLNEERRLPACLGSLPKGAEVVVLDSGSTDGTVAIAEKAGAKVARRAFDNHAAQKNAALALASRRWVLSVDADEVLDERLRQSVEAVARLAAAPYPGYRLTRRLWFMGRRMRFGKTVDHPIRLVLRGRGRFTQDIHERLALDGDPPLGRLGGEAAHYSYDDVSDYFRRFNSYTSKIAENHAQNGRPMPWGPVHWLRPWSEFVTRYIFRLGFLDGYPGYCYALFSSLYTFVKYVKLRERSRA
jgi:glycosyltransferase involved in cell wall biosynthesis